MCARLRQRKTRDACARKAWPSSASSLTPTRAAACDCSCARRPTKTLFYPLNSARPCLSTRCTTMTEPTQVLESPAPNHKKKKNRPRSPMRARPPLTPPASGRARRPRPPVLPFETDLSRARGPRPSTTRCSIRFRLCFKTVTRSPSAVIAALPRSHSSQPWTSSPNGNYTHFKVRRALCVAVIRRKRVLIRTPLGFLNHTDGSAVLRWGAILDPNRKQRENYSKRSSEARFFFFHSEFSEFSTTVISILFAGKVKKPL